MSLVDSPHVETNVHLHAEVIIKLGVDIGMPAPIVLEIPLAGMDGALNLDEFDDPLLMASDARTMVTRWRKEMGEQFPGKYLAAAALEMTGFVQIAKKAVAADIAKETQEAALRP